MIIEVFAISSVAWALGFILASVAVDVVLRAVGFLRFTDEGDFNVDPIELIKTSPGATRRQTLEELAHRLVVEAVATVEDDALHGYGFG